MAGCLVHALVDRSPTEANQAMVTDLESFQRQDKSCCTNRILLEQLVPDCHANIAQARVAPLAIGELQQIHN